MKTKQHFLTQREEELYNQLQEAIEILKEAKNSIHYWIEMYENELGQEPKERNTSLCQMKIKAFLNKLNN